MLSVIGIIFIIIGAVIGSVFAGIDAAAMGSFALEMFGAGLTCADVWNKRNKDVKPVFNVLYIVLIALGSFLLGFVGQVAKEQVTMIIVYVVAIAMIIAGLLIPAIKNKVAKK